MANSHDPQAERLLRELQIHSDLACADADQLLPLLVQREQLGLDVDAQPELQPLLVHLDGCARCATAYATLVADAELTAQPQINPLPTTANWPIFFPPDASRSTGSLVLEVWEGFGRKLRLLWPTPGLRTSQAVMSAQALFSDRVTEFKQPAVVLVNAEIEDAMVTLRIVLRDPATVSIWQIEVRAGNWLGQAVTDQRGLAVIGPLPLAEINRGLEVITRELIDAQS